MARLAAALFAMLALATPAAAAHYAGAGLRAPANFRAFLLRANEEPGHSFARTPAFAWNPVAGAKRYELVLSISPLFRGNGIVWDDATLTTPVGAVPLALPWITGNPHSLYARARAIAANGSVGPWTESYGLEIRSDTIPKPLPESEPQRDPLQPLLPDRDERRRRARVLHLSPDFELHGQGGVARSCGAPALWRADEQAPGGLVRALEPGVRLVQPRLRHRAARQEQLRDHVRLARESSSADGGLLMVRRLGCLRPQRAVPRQRVHGPRLPQPGVREPCGRKPGLCTTLERHRPRLSGQHRQAGRRPDPESHARTGPRQACRRYGSVADGARPWRHVHPHADRRSRTSFVGLLHHHAARIVEYGRTVSNFDFGRRPVGRPLGQQLARGPVLLDRHSRPLAGYGAARHDRGPSGCSHHSADRASAGPADRVLGRRAGGGRLPAG